MCLDVRKVEDGSEEAGRGDWSVGDVRSRYRGLDGRGHQVEEAERKEEG